MAINNHKYSRRGLPPSKGLCTENFLLSSSLRLRRYLHVAAQKMEGQIQDPPTTIHSRSKVVDDINSTQKDQPFHNATSSERIKESLLRPTAPFSGQYFSPTLSHNENYSPKTTLQHKFYTTNSKT